MRILLRITAIIMLCLLYKPLLADDVYTGWFSNKALSGYDAVAYFTVGKAIKGDSAHETLYKGANWYFSSQENLEIFLQNPALYAPQYGGYCANQMSLGNKVAADATIWLIHDEMLYVFGGKKGLKRWQDAGDNINILIEDADKAWGLLKNK